MNGLPYERAEYKKGVNITVINDKDHKSDLIDISFVLPLTEKNASMLSLLAQVLQVGTEHYPDMTEFSRACDDAYSCAPCVQLDKINETLVISFISTSLKNRHAFDGEDIFSCSLELLSEMMYHPYMPKGTFSAAFTEREKQTLISRIKSVKNNKTVYALQKARTEMCKGEPYAISKTGTVESVRSITAKELTEFYKKLLADYPAEIIFIGDTDMQTAIGYTDRYFPLEPRENRIYDVKVIKNAESIKKIEEETDDASQSTLVLGYRTGGRLHGDRFAPFSVFISLFGTSPTAKLFMNVREKLSLCYFCSANADRAKGIMSVVSGIDAANREKAESEIYAQLEDIKNGNFTDDEFSSAVKSIIGSYREISDRVSSMCVYYLSHILAGRLKTPEEEIEEIKKVTPDEVKKIASSMSLDTVFFLKGNA